MGRTQFGRVAGDGAGAAVAGPPKGEAAETERARGYGAAMAGGGGARDAVGVEQGEAGDGVRLAARGMAQGERLQPAEQGGEEGEEQGLDGIQASARSFAIRLRGAAQGGEGFGQIVRLN